MERSKVALYDLFQKKKRGEKIIRMAAYDYPTARLIDEAGLDMILVGDSLGMNVLGFEDTLSVTLEMMEICTAAVRRGARNCFVVGDLPVGTYATPEQAIASAMRLIRSGADAIKLEGGVEICPIVQALTKEGMTVNSHIGLMPQSYKELGGFKVQGRDPRQAMKILHDAIALQEAGAKLLLLEAIPEELGCVISERTDLITISIGAGRYCDAITIVFHDFAGFSRRVPRFVKKYADMNTILREAIGAYKDDVLAGNYPLREHCYPWDEKKKKEFFDLLGSEECV